MAHTMIPSRESNSLEPTAAVDHPKGNALEDLVHSALYSAVQEPISGLAQISDGLFDTNLLPKVQFMAAPEQAKFGSLDWHAEQIGSAIGMVAPFLLVGKGAKFGLNKIGLAGETAEGAGMLARSSSIGFNVREAALTGFAYDAFLKPSDYQKGNATSFLESRAMNGATGAATFTALSLSGLGMSKLADSAAVKDTFMAPVLRNNFAAGVLSGIPAGAVGAELGAWQQGKALPSLSDLGQSVYGYAMVGGTLGLAHSVRTSAAEDPRFQNLATKVQTQLASIRSSAADALNNAGKRFPPSEGFAARGFASSSDSVSPNPDATTRPALQSEAVRQLVQRLESQQPEANSLRDHQYYVKRELDRALAAEKQNGTISDEWKVYGTKLDSPADDIGADYLLLNRTTGEFHFLDATSNGRKFANQDEFKEKVPEIRRAGVLYYDKNWFDEAGLLRVDPTEPADIQNGVLAFRENLGAALVKATSKPSLLNANDLPLPSILPISDEEKHEQVTRFAEAVKARSAKPDVAAEDQRTMEDFARSILTSTGNRLLVRIQTADSPEFRDRIARSADKTILSRAVDLVLNRTSDETKVNKPRSNISYHAKTKLMFLDDGEGTLYSSGDMATLLGESRRRMLNSDAILANLSKSQLRDLQAAFPGASDARIALQVQSKLTNMASEMSTGGALGNGRPVLIDEIAQRLRQGDLDTLLGRAKPPKVSLEKQPPISAETKQAATDFAAQWYQEGCERPVTGELPNAELVELVFDSMPATAATQALFEQYKSGDAAAVKLIDETLQQHEQK